MLTLVTLCFAMPFPFRHTIVHNVDKAQSKVRNKKDNVAGKMLLN